MEESVEKKPSPLAPFLTKCYDMVEDPATDSIVSWSSSNDSFIILDLTAFCKELLPKYFKHSNFSSFVRQLNTYGFRKADPDRWEFVNEGFIKGQKHLLRTITRKKHSHGLIQPKQPQKKSTSVGACVEVGKFGLHEEVESLKRDKNVLMQELVKVRQQQQIAEGKLRCLSTRLQGMEKAQQQMLSFLAMAMQNPGFLSQLFQQNENWRMTDKNKKRRPPTLEQGVDDDEPVAASDGQIVMYQPSRNETSNPFFMQTLDANVSSDLENGSNELMDMDVKQGIEDDEPVASDGQIVTYQPQRNETPNPFFMPTSDSNVSSDLETGIDEFFMNMDFMSSLVEKDSASSENGGLFILPDLPDEQLLEQLLLAGPFLENVEETESNIAAESMDTEVEVESAENNTTADIKQSVESTGHDNSLETSQKMDILTEQMEFLGSETNTTQDVCIVSK